MKKTPPSPSLSSLDISIQGSTPRTTQIQDVRVKLPKLELSKFDGDIINWQGFWDQFLIAIHENDSLADIDKFTYLKSFLSDSALQSINGLSLNATNYKEAIDILHQRYGNKQVLISAHMQKLEKLPRIKSSNDINGLRKMYDQTKFCVRNLKALNIDIATYGAILVPFLNGKLPSEIRVILSRNFQNDIWQLDDMLKILKREVEAKERSFSIGTSSEFEPEKRDRHYTTSAFLNSSLERKCPFCNLNNHPASKCLKVTNMAARKQILRQKGMCLICFNSDHLAKMCQSSYKCRKCNGKHHISICTFEKRDESVKTESQNDTKRPQLTFQTTKTLYFCKLRRLLFQI